MEISTRKEKMIEAIIKDDPSLIPAPVSREEMMLASMAKVTCEGNGGGGIKTAIFRNEHFDEYMGGDETAYSTDLECVNMTREEMIQTIESGQPVDYIIIHYGDSGVGLIVGRPQEPRIEWYPEKNELRIAGAGYWFPNGYIGDLAE